MLIMLFKNITNASWQGSMFLILSCIYIIFILATIISQKKVFKYSISYNLLSIGVNLYLLLIWIKVFIDERVKLDIIYELDMTYFKNNYVILSFVLIGILLNTLFLYIDSYTQKKIDESVKL